MRGMVSNLKGGGGTPFSPRTRAAAPRAGGAAGGQLVMEPGTGRRLLKTARQQRFFLLALVPFVAYGLVFFYYPMYGVLIAFKEFSYTKGILGSPWAGFTYFERFLRSPDFALILRNTLATSLLNLFLGFPIPIAFAILITEMRHRNYKRFVQTVSYLPNFIAWIVVAGMVQQLLSREGTVNTLLLNAGILRAPASFLGGNGAWFWVLIFVLNRWKSVGWDSIIFIAAITAINPEYYEAAVIDGANRRQRIIHVTIPLIMPTAVLLFVLSLGYLLSAGFEQQLFLMNPLNHDFAEVIDTYVFKYGLQFFMFSYGAAVGLLKAVVALVLVVMANTLMKRFTSTGVF
jgi:putative aldouronate transport system permease protein